MPNLSEREILARYHNRFSRIESEVHEPPPFSRVSRRARALSVPRVLAAPMAALILGLTVFVGIPMIVGRFSTAVVSTGSSSPSVPLAPVPSGNGTLDVIVRLEPLSEPSGIVIAPAALANAHFQARLSTADGQLVATWPVTRGVTSRQTYAPGVYRLTVWRYIVMDQGETGARVTGPPEDECAIDLTLDASQSTSIVASFPWSTGACSFTISQ